MPSWNDIKSCDSYQDNDAKIGHFGSIFDYKLYGYYYPSACGNECKEGYLRFILFFAHPFDIKLDTPVFGKSDFNGFCKQETDGFNNIDKFERSLESKNIQIVTLQYKDACNYCEIEFLDGLFRFLNGKNPWSYLPQIESLKDNSLLFKVTFDVPFDVIADYIRVDKILLHDDGSFEQQKNIYVKSDGKNKVEILFRKMTRVESLFTEMGDLIREIKNHPELYKRASEFKPTNTQYDSYYKECYDFNQKCRTERGYNIEHADELLIRAKKALDDMHKVIFQARYFDIKSEPVVSEKCAHWDCNRIAEIGSKYCNKCVQLNTKQCNFCGDD